MKTLKTVAIALAAAACLTVSIPSAHAACCDHCSNGIAPARIHPHGDFGHHDVIEAIVRLSVSLP